MVGPLKAVSALVRKLKRKRRLATELHSRWGDVSISYPTQGSWSQWDQPSGFAVNATEARSEESQSHRQPSSSTQGTVSRLPASLRRSGSGDELSGDLGVASMPTGHYDTTVRCRSRMKHAHLCLGPGVGDNGDSAATQGDTDAAADRSDSDEDSPTVRIRGRDTETTRNTATDEARNSQRASKSPPLSFTSRMRRYSQQSSTTTEPTGSMPGTASSHTTSFAASSASWTDDPRLGYNAAYQEKKHQLRSKYHEEPALRQELVPSYDELYG
ncbi:hypothetical protein PHISP_04226 [Aspergillus sp. HF37]|nr:hypothetical protein PHISP_04226 [Aspergillus sp. HF37]